MRNDRFRNRHIGINDSELDQMLSTIGVNNLEELIDQTIPENIRMNKELDLPKPLSEFDYLKELKLKANDNKVYRSYMGMGYYGTITPSPILRNIFQNPGWYTQYTPYQAEISQGRLEALLNFQTTVSDLTGLPIANASLLDEATAAAEAMAMFYALKNKRSKENEHNRFLVDEGVLPQTLDVVKTRAKSLGIIVEVGQWSNFSLDSNVFGTLVQYPAQNGEIGDFRNFVAACKEKEIYSTFAADILSLTILTPPGEMGADAVIGNTQRFGVPMGFGGPHAAYFATKDEFRRLIPGRIIGVSMDVHGNKALRMALQTREQHIRREKATSNICTAQALLAIMAGTYAVYHGPDGLKAIGEYVHNHTAVLASNLKELGLNIENEFFFDTISIAKDELDFEKVKSLAKEKEINFYFTTSSIRISLDETVDMDDVSDIIEIFKAATGKNINFDSEKKIEGIPQTLLRQTAYLKHPVFHSHQTETKLMRYLKSLENKDISLMHSMIPLGSCTMKLNAATQLIPVSWPEFANIHPFAPSDQTAGYRKMLDELSDFLCEITGFEACSLQPNSGAQGEFAGLLTIANYHQANGNAHRNIALIPSSAHGTNPASAVMAGMKVVVVKCDERGNVDLIDLKEKAELHKDNLASLMVTYPSTHGVFEKEIIKICDLVHQNGGMVYMDGANMNAQVGLTSPGRINADVCHLNLHKTFSIPHGGGGPGMGPICVNAKLAPYLPNHILDPNSKEANAVSAAPYGSASILLISYAYIKMLGFDGVKEATKYAILNANYIKARLESQYDVLYSGENGRAAHELIIDLRKFKPAGISAEDVAKRLIDYGFHSPTLSFPVAGTLMIEPTESESKDELDRFCEAMLQIKEEIDEVSRGEYDQKSNVLCNAPHTQAIALQDEWPYSYSREKAVFPAGWLKNGSKFWATVGRVNNAFGDRNLICTCPPIESYSEEEMA